jgi:leishmanolysin
MPLLAVVLLALCAAGEHRCDHDSAELTRLIYHHGMDQVAPQRAESRNGLTAAVGSLRVSVTSNDLDDSSKYCSSAAGTAPDFKGSLVQCTEATVLTAAKKDILLTKIIPAALQLIGAAVSVNRLTANLVVPSTTVCPNFAIPAAHTTTGVANTDFSLYLAAGPTTGGTVAWAGYCMLDSTQRPVVGRMNFSPQFIVWGADNAEVIYTAVHELLHALGFSYTFISQNFVKNNATATIVSGTARGGAPVNRVVTPAVVAKTKEFFNCASLTGCELENEGGAGTVNSHWQRRNHKDDVMSPIVGTSLSPVTLALLEDSGHYFVDYAKADAPQWGRVAGCAFVNDKCDSAAAGVGKYWCRTNDETGCTFDGMAMGSCKISTYTSSLQSFYQYFSNPALGGPSTAMMDYCPFVVPFSNRLCSVPRAATATEVLYGWSFTATSRCVAVTNLLDARYNANVSQACLGARCPGGSRVQLSVAGASTWVDCPANGAAGTVAAPAGFRGTIQCPAAADICTAALLVSESTAAATSTAVPTTTVAGQTQSPPAATQSAQSTAAPPMTTASPTASSAAPVSSTAPGATSAAPSTSVSFTGYTTSKTQAALITAVATHFSIPTGDVDIVSFDANNGRFELRFTGSQSASLTSQLTGMAPADRSSQLTITQLTGNTPAPTTATGAPPTGGGENGVKLSPLYIGLIIGAAALLILVGGCVVLTRKKKSGGGGQPSVDAQQYLNTPMMQQPTGREMTPRSRESLPTNAARDRRSSL